MAHIAFPRNAKSLNLSSGHTYAYVYIPAQPNKATILFLHGFPSSSYDWRHQISFFANEGYGVLAPDLLGYGGTSKPASTAEYKAKKMVAEIEGILDHEKLQRVHAVSHDIGSTLLSRLANYLTQRLLSCTFLGVPYSRPGSHFDLDAVNAMTKNLLGKEKFGYLRLFVEDYAGNLLDEHSDSFFTLFYPAEANLWDDHMGPTGSMEAWLREDRQAPLASYITSEEKAMHQRILGGNHGTALKWYHPLVYNMNEQDEIDSALANQVARPVLMVFPFSTADQYSASESKSIEFANGLTIKGVSTRGHWLQLEAKDQVNAILKEFFEQEAST
ncbi:hypothetical protein N7456_013408 [Penicillium angulare]|uniref:AB hydrolase-1 domain-containing protein n=1 Tax=Penicillium angulare TaxID=116970 RepID=A0A9W9EG86_9EURO|nr:hypothetical protein N7456_013408 [Penicillium angulare]